MAQQTFTCIDSEQQEKVEWNDSVGNGSDQWRKIGLDFLLLLFLLRLLKHLVVVVVIIVIVDDHDHQMKSYHSVFFLFSIRLIPKKLFVLFCSIVVRNFWNLISHIDKNHFKFHCCCCCCSVEYIWLQLICCCFQCQSDHQNWSIDQSINQWNEMILIQIIITIAATTNNNNKSCVWLQILSISFSLTTKKINLI